MALLDFSELGNAVIGKESQVMGTSYLTGTDPNTVGAGVAITGLAGVAAGAVALDQHMRKKQSEQQGNDPGLLAKVQGTVQQVEGLASTASQLSNMAQSGGIPGVKI
jgi:hypothetical protein